MESCGGYLSTAFLRLPLACPVAGTTRPVDVLPSPPKTWGIKRSDSRKRRDIPGTFRSANLSSSTKLELREPGGHDTYGLRLGIGRTIERSPCSSLSSLSSPAADRSPERKRKYEREGGRLRYRAPTLLADRSSVTESVRFRDLGFGRRSPGRCELEMPCSGRKW